MAVTGEILSTASQTVFSGLPLLPASKNDFIVFVNNVVADVDNYTRTGDNEITFDSGLNKNDKVRVLVPFEIPTSCSSNMVFPDSPTLSELYTKVRKEMRVDRTGRIWSNEDIKEAINLSILTVQKATNFGWQVNDACQNITTITSQESYTIADNTQGIKVVKYNGRALGSTKKETIEELNKTLPTGDPKWYYIWNGNIGFSPIPSTSNGTVEIFYQKFLVPLSDDSDTLPFKSDFTKAVVLYAAYSLFSQTADNVNIQRAQVKKVRYQEELNTIRLAYLVPDSNQIKYKTSYVPRGTRRGIAGRLIN